MSDFKIIRKVFFYEEDDSVSDFKEIRKIFSPDKTPSKEAEMIRKIFTNK